MLQFAANVQRVWLFATMVGRGVFELCFHLGHSSQLIGGKSGGENVCIEGERLYLEA